MVVGDFTQKVETVIIGAGPGGYVAAIRAAQLGQEVVLIEKEFVGGVCLNWGCIPSKAMIEVSGLKKHLEKAAEMGIIVKDVSVDLNQLHKWKNGVVEKLRTGVSSLLSKNGVDVIQGTASFTEPGKILVASEHGIQRFEFKNLILATGSSPISLPGIPFDHELVIDSTDALGLEQVPERMVVVGAGSVGIELGLVYAKLGSDVTIIEFQDQFLPFLDPELPKVLEKSLKKNGVKLLLGTKVEQVTPRNGKAEIRYSQTGKQTTIEAEKVLVAIGRRPNTQDIGLETIGLKVDSKGFIQVNEKMQTQISGIYAIGDLVQGPMLAHRASHMGKIAAEVISGKPAAFDNLAIPGVIFSDPEIATVGLTEAQAQQQGYKVKAGVFPFRALGRAMTIGETEGLTKVISDADSGTVLGVHIIGPHASDLIAEGALAVESASHVDDLTLTIHAHPTLPEGIEEAAEAVENKAIHIFNPKM
ncbi:MAG: dihydrolipoyl dehydrogenase [candidate division KSB1 bacterium]|nr:dihydrolipoyl dehydrogenase [candidate division KSB1 bacterium]MDZ7402376.1 dihydrolipoyl dehydrogenase [candidate division KSB1 bacterium]